LEVRHFRVLALEFGGAGPDFGVDFVGAVGVG
jgi:hypothetical protein